MAKIFKTSLQEKALKEIMDDLKTVASLNSLLEYEEMGESKVKIQGRLFGKSVSEQVTMPYAFILPTLKDYRKKLISGIQNKSKTYNIQLDDDEKEIISKTIVPRKEDSKQEKKSEEYLKNDDQNSEEQKEDSEVFSPEKKENEMLDPLDDEDEYDENSENQAKDEYETQNSSYQPNPSYRFGF